MKPSLQGPDEFGLAVAEIREGFDRLGRPFEAVLARLDLPPDSVSRETARFGTLTGPAVLSTLAAITAAHERHHMRMATGASPSAP